MTWMNPLKILLMSLIHFKTYMHPILSKSKLKVMDKVMGYIHICNYLQSQH